MLTRVLLLATGLVLAAASLQAQRFGFVDSRYILEQMPEYAAAQKGLDDLSRQWQEELDAMYATIDEMYAQFRAEEVLLSPEVREQRQALIREKEQAAAEYQKQRFGYEGDLFKEREARVRPIQERLFAAIAKVAKDNGLQFMFDRASGELIMLYADPNFDYTNKVLTQLGISPQR